MAKVSPQNMPIAETFSFDGSLNVKNNLATEDTVSVKDSAIYQIQKWKYLVKKQISNRCENELLVWLDEIANQGWELISGQSGNLGFYIFKKPAQ